MPKKSAAEKEVLQRALSECEKVQMKMLGPCFEATDFQNFQSVFHAFGLVFEISSSRRASVEKPWINHYESKWRSEVSKYREIAQNNLDNDLLVRVLIIFFTY